MKLYFYGSELVSQPEYFPVEVVSPSEGRFIRKVEERMLAVMEQFKLRGLAAPQVGIPLRMIVVRLKNQKILTLLNPTIDRMYGHEVEYSEGCISCPPGGNSCRVARMQVIDVTGSRVERPDYEEKWQFRGQESRIIQHEVDHLTGTFFLDRASVVEKTNVLEKFHQWKNNYRHGEAVFSHNGGNHGRSSRNGNASVSVA